jgi:hypothetical protein
MSETIAIQFLVTLITPFMVAYGIGYLIRKSIKVIALWSNRQLQRDTEMGRK